MKKVKDSFKNHVELVDDIENQTDISSENDIEVAKDIIYESYNKLG